MKIVRVVAVVVLVYVGIVVAFESLIGILQPETGETLVITTFDADGTPHDRVVSRLEVGGQLYVAANHWPRAWYERALDRPEVKVDLGEGQGAYQAVDVTGAEHARVDDEHGLPIVFRFLTGFPPRYFLRLEPS